MSGSCPSRIYPPGKGPPICIEEVSGWAPQQIQTPQRLAILFFLLGIEAQFLGHPNHTLVHPLKKKTNKQANLNPFLTKGL